MVQSPSYRTVRVTLPALAERTVNASGTVIRVLEADAPFEMSFGDDSFFEAEAGLGFEPFTPDGAPQTFRTLRFRNPNATAIEARVQVGTGNILDNRVVFGGMAVPIEMALDGVPLRVKAAETLPVSSPAPLDIKNAQATALFNEMDDLRGGSVKRLGSSFFEASVSPAGTTVVSSVANVNGVVVSNFVAHGLGVASAGLQAGGFVVIAIGANADAKVRSYDGPSIFIPAGHAVSAWHSATGLVGVSWSFL